MKKIILCSIAALFSMTALAQYYAASTNGSGPGAIIKTGWAVGYVVKRDGKRMEGEIQLKVIDSDTLEIRFSDVNNNKQIFARPDILSFGVLGKSSTGHGRSGKIGDQSPGYAMLDDGTKLEGQVLSYSGFEGSFKRTYFGFFIIATGRDAKYFPPDGDASYIVQSVKGKEVKYLPLTESFVVADEFLSSLKANKDPLDKLQKGSIVFKDGTKKEGQVAQLKKAVILNVGEKFESLNFTSSNIKYFTQNIDGADRKFAIMMSGMRAFSGPQNVIVEILSPSETFSYYKNPAPTHLKKGLTKLAKSAINTTTDVGRIGLANEAAKQAVKSELKDSDKNPDNVGNAVQAGAEAQANVLDQTKDMGVGDEGGLYHEEWVIVNNSTGTNVVLYNGNEDEVITGLLHKCSNFSSLEKAQLKKLTDADNIEQVVKYLNVNKCY